MKLFLEKVQQTPDTPTKITMKNGWTNAQNQFASRKENTGSLNSNLRSYAKCMSIIMNRAKPLRKSSSGALFFFDAIILPLVSCQTASYRGSEDRVVGNYEIDVIKVCKRDQEIPAYRYSRELTRENYVIKSADL